MKLVARSEDVSTWYIYCCDMMRDHWVDKFVTTTLLATRLTDFCLISTNWTDENSVIEFDGETSEKNRVVADAIRAKLMEITPAVYRSGSRSIGLYGAHDIAELCTALHALRA